MNANDQNPVCITVQVSKAITYIHYLQSSLLYPDYCCSQFYFGSAASKANTSEYGTKNAHKLEGTKELT